MNIFKRIFASIKAYRKNTGFNDVPDAPDVEAMRISPLFDTTFEREQIVKTPGKKES